MDCIVHGVTKSQTRLSDFHFQVTGPHSSCKGCYGKYLASIASTGFPNGTRAKESACRCKRRKRWVLSLDWEDRLEEGTAHHSGILARRNP